MTHLKRLTPDDWRLWRELRLAALEESPLAFGSRLGDWQGAGDRENRWRQRLSDVPLNIVAYMNETPGGMVSGQSNGSDTELMSLWVAPFARGAGVSDQLVEAVMAWSKAQKATRLLLSVRDHNAAAIRLYYRHGFHPIGPSPESEPGAPETLFTKPIIP